MYIHMSIHIKIVIFMYIHMNIHIISTFQSSDLKGLASSTKSSQLSSCVRVSSLIKVSSCIKLAFGIGPVSDEDSTTSARLSAVT